MEDESSCGDNGSYGESDSYDYDDDYGISDPIVDSLASADDASVSPVERARLHCQQITDHISGVRAICLPTGGYSMCIWICMSFKRLRLGTEHAVALGLDPAYPWIAARLAIRHSYDTCMHTEVQPMVK